MNFDDLVKRVSEVTPPFNDHALRGFVKHHINTAHEFTAVVFQEGFKFINKGIELVGYEILSPEDQIRFELRPSPGKSTKAKIPLTTSHMRLVRYKVRMQGRPEQFESNLYMPYMYKDMLHIRSKYSMVRKVILERTFSRVHERGKDGMSVSPIRVNLVFNRFKVYSITSYVTAITWRSFIVTARMFHGKPGKKLAETTILHYMLAKFGFVKTIHKFGFNQSDLDFTTEVGNDTDEYEYFAAKNENGGESTLLLRVRKTLLGETQSRKFVINLLYVLLSLPFFSMQTISSVYQDNPSLWKVILGIIIFGDRQPLKAIQNAEANIQSADTFIDPLTKKRLQNFGVVIEDTYDLLVYIFEHIDSFMVNYLVQDLYNMRLDVVNGMLVKSLAERIFKNIYELNKKSNFTPQDVKRAIQPNPMLFRQPSGSRVDEEKDYVAPPDIVGDNYLLAGGLSKIRLNGRAEQRYDPSMVVAESADAFTGKIIGKTGYLNPFIPTDEHGAILHPDYARDSIDLLKRYLPR